MAGVTASVTRKSVSAPSETTGPSDAGRLMPSSGAEADGEASEVESGGERRAAREDAVPAPKVEKPQWMVELAAKNAAKRAAQANN